jgi:hypothetical protein
MAAYKGAREEFEAAQEQWESYLATPGASEPDPIAAEAIFDRLKAANQARDDAVDLLWVAWRNRPDPA